MSGTLREILKGERIRGISGALLQGVRVQDISEAVFPISVRSLREAFSKALRKAEVEDFRFRDLRHAFATRLVQNGVDIYKAKEPLGHKPLAMTMRYAHHYPESLRRLLQFCYIRGCRSCGNPEKSFRIN